MEQSPLLQQLFLPRSLYITIYNPSRVKQFYPKELGFLGLGIKQYPTHVKLHPWALNTILGLPKKFCDFWSYQVFSKIPKV
jgi:hypothetical protein